MLLDQQPWAALWPIYDLTVFLHVALADLEKRLVQRWMDHGPDPIAVRKRVLDNDLENAKLVESHSVVADFTLTE